MKKKLLSILCVTVLTCTMFAGCGGASANDGSADSQEEKISEDDSNSSQEEEEAEDVSSESGEMSEPEAEGAELADGVYSAAFDTDSGMFHVNEANEGRGVLTVEGGKMTLHVSLASKNIVNLFAGTAEDAQKDGAELLEPTTDTVTYSDGMSEEVYGFDIPVPAIDQEFDLALIGSKGKWYDHKVSVTDPQPQE